MRLITLTICVLYGFSAFSQSNNCNRTIDGKVVDIDTKEPLPFATIKIQGTTNGAVSDENGLFQITNICEDEVDLEIRFLGYKTVVHHHDFHHPSPIIFLASDATLLEGVVIEQALNAHELKTLSSKKIKIDNLKSLGVNAGDLLSENSGVGTLKTGQNIVKPIVHGLHSNRVLIVNNGVRHANQAWGDDHGIEIDVSQIDQIQLIKGASTVRYGSDALGGVILFNAPSPAYSTSLNGAISGGFNTNGRGISGEFSLQEGYERVSWRASVSGTKQGDLRAPNYLLTNTGKEEFGFTANGRFHFSRIDLDVFISHFDQNLGILRGSVSGNLNDLSRAIQSSEPLIISPFSYDINNPRQEVIHDLAKIGSSIFIGEQQFDVQYAIQRNTRREFDVRRGDNNERPAINLELISQSLDVDWDHPSQGNWAGTLGFQAFAQNNNNIFGTNTIPFVPNFNTLNLSAFAVESYASNGTTYEAGLRFDFLNMDVRGRDASNDIYRDNVSYQNFTFTLGIIKEFSKKLTLRSNIGSAWRAPNVNELYGFGKHQNVFEYGLWRYEYFADNDSISTRNVLTSDLKEVKSERGLKWVTTLNYNDEGTTLELTPHINWIKNYFFLRPFGVTQTVRGTFPYFIHDQTDALYAGFDLDIVKEWSNTYSSELKVSYVYARDIKNDQNFIGIPPLNIRFSMEKRVGNFNVKLSPEYEANQNFAPDVISIDEFETGNPLSADRTATFDFVNAPSDFFLLNASIEYETGKFQLRLNAENLLNTNYRRYTDNLRYYADDLGIGLGIYASFAF